MISLFLGGRASAFVSRVRGIGPGAIQGALIAVPFTILMMLLTFISSYNTVGTSTGGTSSANTVVQTAGAGALDVVLWSLLFGAAIGAIGGMYQNSAIKMGVSKFLSALATPSVLMSKPVASLLNRLSKQQATSRNKTRTLLYTAFFWILVLAIAAGVVGGLFIGLNQSFTKDVNQRIRDIGSVVIVVLPDLLILSTCAVALCHDYIYSSIRAYDALIGVS